MFASKSLTPELELQALEEGERVMIKARHAEIWTHLLANGQGKPIFERKERDASALP